MVAKSSGSVIMHSMMKNETKFSDYLGAIALAASVILPFIPFFFPF